MGIVGTMGSFFLFTHHTHHTHFTHFTHNPHYSLLTFYTTHLTFHISPFTLKKMGCSSNEQPIVLRLGQGEPELQATDLAVVDLDVATMKQHSILDDRKTEACASKLA